MGRITQKPSSGVATDSKLAATDSKLVATDSKVVPKPGQVTHLKILHFNGDSSTSTPTPVSNLRAPWSSEKEKEQKTLGDLRDSLTNFVKFDYGFCLHDSSYVSDETSIQQYLQQCVQKGTEAVNATSQSDTNAGISQPDIYGLIYIKDQTRQLNPDAILQGQFILKIVDKGSETEEHGSIHSSELQGSRSELTLAMIRPHVKVPNAEGSSFDFCFEDKTIAPDSILLKAYFEKGMNPKDVHTSLSVMPIYIRKVIKTKAEVLKGNFIIRFVKKGAGGESNEGDTSEGSVASHELGVIDAVCLSHLRAHIRSMSANSSRHEFCMADGTSMSDGTKLETYLSLDPNKEEPKTQTPIFTVYFQRVASKRIFGGASQEMKDRTNIDTKTDLKFGEGVKNPISGEGMRRRAADMSDMGISNEFINSLAIRLPSEIVYPSQLDENQWDDILQNCNVFYGWKFDLATLSISRAPYAAFKLRKNLNMSVPNGVELPTEVMPVSATLPQQLPQSAEGQAQEKIKDEDKDRKKEDGQGDVAGEADEAKTLPAKPSICKPNAIPTFRITDDSRVEVSVVSSRMQESMARNNFTASSFEVGAAGSIKGVDIGVSGGKSERQEQSEGSVATRTEKIMVGNYRFPRVQLLLRSGDLEPTDELIAAVRQVKATKSLETLRALHDKFGHLFCEDVVLGGSLQTTRVTKGSDNVTETALKSQFKAEVGAAVSAPKIGSLNMKYSKESGKDESNSKQETHVSDNVVFEATGGNTVLVTNPPEWILSILQHQNWRVIERGNLKPLANVLAACASPEVRGVRQWFVQAVPILSQYIRIPASRSLPVRFRVMPQVPTQLTLFPDLSKSFYLGHEEKKPVHPIRVSTQRNVTRVNETQQQRQIADSSGIKNAAEWAGKILPFNPLAQLASAGARRLPSGAYAIDITRETIELRATEEVALFTPARAQAPVLLQYDDAIKQSSLSIATHDETIWDMIVPHDDILKNNSQVMLRSRASHGSPNQNRWLTVYRTFEGSFMPGITSDQGASIWRLVRDKTMRPDAKNDYFQEGDLVRLSWSFADQTAGFRNFQLDTFGRRCYQKPIDVAAPTLFFKLPFPGFGNTSRTDGSDTSGQAMMMSGESTQLPILTQIWIKNTGSGGLLMPKPYNFHDLSFRLDVVSNDGQGELLDYMTDGLSQQDREVVEHELSRRAERFSPVQDAITRGADDAGRAIMGPMYDVVSGPAKSIIRGFAGIFGL